MTRRYSRQLSYYHRITFRDIKEATLARDNYSYKKYARELAKKKKKEEKLQRKLDNKNAKPDDTPEQAPGEDAGVNPGP
jgi:hypothetical protein